MKAGGQEVRFEQIRDPCGKPPTQSPGLSNGEIREVAMTAAFANFLNTSEVSGILRDREEVSA